MQLYTTNNLRNFPISYSNLHSLFTELYNVQGVFVTQVQGDSSRNISQYYNCLRIIDEHRVFVSHVLHVVYTYWYSI